MNLDVSADADSAIERLCDLIAGAAPRSLVVTGGTTAGAAYELLASEAWRERLDWSRVTLYLGDERRVPPDDPGSCYLLVAETLLTGVTPAGVERMRGEEPDGDAEAVWTVVDTLVTEAVAEAGGRVSGVKEEEHAAEMGTGLRHQALCGHAVPSWVLHRSPGP